MWREVIAFGIAGSMLAAAPEVEHYIGGEKEKKDVIAALDSTPVGRKPWIDLHKTKEMLAKDLQEVEEKLLELKEKTGWKFVFNEAKDSSGLMQRYSIRFDDYNNCLQFGGFVKNEKGIVTTFQAWDCKPYGFNEGEKDDFYTITHRQDGETLTAYTLHNKEPSYCDGEAKYEVFLTLQEMERPLMEYNSKLALLAIQEIERQIKEREGR